MNSIELENCYLRMRSLAKALDVLIESSYEESSNEIITLSEMLIETFDKYDNIKNNAE
ncbi:MAG: hypothetical protein NC485_09110 [Ruminococcus flavefaciens]|nr:hypothetical protein [Ruminococcus flavefaciens]MCM1062247.1 hypothetical protein [Eubacterium sp.]